MIRSTLSLLYLSFFSLCVRWLGLPKSIYQSATTTERWFLSLFLSFFFIDCTLVGWLCHLWNDSSGRVRGRVRFWSKSTCCCCWVNSQSFLAEWVYKSTCCCCCWVNSWVPWQSFQLLLHLLQVLLGWWIPEFFAEFPTPPLVASVAEWIANAAQVFEIMIFWCSKSGQHPFIYSKM